MVVCCLFCLLTSQDSCKSIKNDRDSQALCRARRQTDESLQGRAQKARGMLFLLRRPSTAEGREVLCLSTSAPAGPRTEVSQAWRDGDGGNGR